VNMASYKEHCAECVQKLGEPFYVVHRWLDEFFVKMGCHVRHRDIRHHEKGIEEARKMWGDKAAEAARLHIATDFGGWVPKDEMEVQKWRCGVVQVPIGYEMQDGILVKIPDSLK
jgi:hypothetical protein